MEKSWLKHYPDHISTEIEVPDIPVAQLLSDTASDHPSKPALSFYGKETSYYELNRTVDMLGSSLQQNGMQKGDRVAVMLPNCPQYVMAYFGTLRAGGIITQVNPMLVERELQMILQDSGAETIFVLDKLYPRVKAVQADTNLKTIIVVTLPPSGEKFDPDYSFETFLKSGNGYVEDPEIDPAHDVAVLQYTGGTTGRSKGAMLTHRNLVANLVQTYMFFKDDIKIGTDRVLTVIPLFHVFGMTSGMNLAVYTASKNILLPRFELEEVLQTIKREQPTVFPGVPTMYVAITSHPEAEKFGIDSIRTCNSGSAPMPLGLMNDFERKTGANILEGYGLSEASPTTHCNPPFAGRKPGSIGIGLPSTEYKVVDIGSGTEELAPGELGELVIRGPQVMKGYWNMPEETAATLRDGWLHTGDIAKMDEEGYVYIVDRKKDLIIASGYNIYPRDIEEVLYEHPAVQEAVTIGVPDRYRGETVKAVIVLKQGQDASPEELKAYCRENLASYKVPEIIEFRSELPKTSVGKILRRALREEKAGEVQG
ncbi:long-chain-fatty-acid--CoA ligase [Bacillus marinisedimentorum]|uniref:long-chain-fatty-acid--CoA ligase n=1 Tax=Bacillus marinisedimentorum TaxID=1821260 RepID=UPI0007E00ABE|nr:long-chain fatty acid--CoA ligase [Bacillus marinisedimentorum]